MGTHDNNIAIKVTNLTKDFHVRRNLDGQKSTLGRFLFPQQQIVRVVDNISFSIEHGEAVGYIGVNGSGKSTTIKMMCGILVPTTGSISVMGLTPHKQRQRNALNIGGLFGQRSSLWWDVPVSASLSLLKRIYQIPTTAYRQNLAIFDDVLDLGELMNVPVRELSLGQRMRANLAATFLHNPKVIYLDEPTIGLDVLVKKRIRDFLHLMIEKRGCTLILTTHDMRDVEEVCSRIIIINKGKVLFDGPANEIAGKYSQLRVLVVQFAKADVSIAIPEGYQVEIFKSKDNVVWLQFDPQICTATDIIRHLMNHYPVIDIRIEEPNLERVIQHIFNGGEK
jgi:ABC-2 type transport system ATP-binding protein